MIRSIFIALTLLFSCQQASSGKTLKIQMLNDPESFNPREVYSIFGATMCKLLYDGLTRLDADGKPVEAVAESITLSQDQLTYTFKLRETYWSDGQPVTADDFIRSWHSETPSPNAHYFSIISKTDVPDSQTLVVTLKHPAPYFLELLSNCFFCPIRDGATNGPFLLDTYSPQCKVLLRKSPTYWDAAAVKLDGISFQVVSDEMTALHLFENGELDWIGSPLATLSLAHLKRLKSEGLLSSYPIAATFWFSLNTNRAPLNHPKVRKALAYAINRQAIIDHILAKTGDPATGPVPLVMGLQNTPYFQDGNLELAKQLFQEALEEMELTLDEFPTLTLLATNNDEAKKIVQTVQQQWQETLNIEIKLHSTDFQVKCEKMTHKDYDIGLAGWQAAYNDPLAFLENWEAEDHCFNDTCWENAEFTKLITLAKNEPDMERRQTYLQEAERLFVDEMPLIPSYHRPMTYVKNKRVSGVYLPVAGAPDFTYAEVTK